ncbi:MAG: hypothetical protein M1541_17385, partial [Acidobacteria bacterium]|nr:hypothetical protein [Acidobacteriota bacterium]
KRLVVLVLMFSLFLPSALDAQKRGKGKKKKSGQNPEAAQVVNLPPATIAGEIPGDRASDPGRQSDWPAIAYSGDGSLYTVYIEWNDKDADRVIVRRRDAGGAWGQPVAIDDGCWDHYSPTIVGRRNGALAVWSGQSNGNFELYASEISASGQASRPERLTNAPSSDFNARAVADASGNVTVVWQSFRKGNGDIFARRLTGANCARPPRRRLDLLGFLPHRQLRRVSPFLRRAQSRRTRRHDHRTHGTVPQRRRRGWREPRMGGLG